VTTRADPLPVEEGLLAQAADEAIARAQQLSMMLTGEQLTPRLELGLSALTPSRGPTLVGARLAEPIAPAARQGGLAGWWPGRARGDAAAAAEPRYPLKGLLVPLLVFAGLLATVVVTSGDGTRGVLALGVVAVAVLIVLIPVLARRQSPGVPPAEAKEVLDVMAGVILATHPGRDAPAAGGAETAGAGAEGTSARG
jgi:hypothetical protein